MKKKIAVLTPSLILGSGGIREIFNKMQALINDNYECHAYIEGNTNIYELNEQVGKFYGTNEVIIHSGWKIEEPFDLVISTIWYSAEIVANLSFNCHKAYLIQDFESLFNAMGDRFLFAENSYQFGLLPLTLGKWLPSLLNRKFGIRSRYFDFCAQTETYYKEDNIAKKECAVAFIFQPEKPRRCYQIGLQALSILKNEIPAVEIYLYGSNDNIDIPFEHVNLGILKLNKINELYNNCTVGLCISSSNPSRIPFEMMSAGLPVVDVYMDNNLYDFPEDGILLAQPAPHSIARAVKIVLNDEKLQKNMSDAGRQFMCDRNMNYEFGQFLEGIHSIFNKEFQKNSVGIIDKSYKKKSII
jgi:O-antigen biosynthesis protein